MALGEDAVARSRLDDALGCYPPDLRRTWVLDDHYDAAEVAEYVPDNRNVGSDDSCVTDDLLAEVSVAGAGFFSNESGMAWNTRALSPCQRWRSAAVCF